LRATQPRAYGASVQRSYWRDHDGIVHILDGTYHVMLCQGLYRLSSDRFEIGVPTCLQCIAKDGAKPQQDWRDDDDEPMGR
jgi:hypothetical protein